LSVSPNRSGVTTTPPDGVSVFLTETKYFKFQYLIISARVQLCTSFASFNTSRSRIPTETQLKRAIMKIVGVSTGGGASDTKKPSLLLLNKKRHMFLKELESWLERGQIVPFLREKRPRKKCTPNIGAAIGAITGILLTAFKL
jgi:hypothetical protein